MDRLIEGIILSYHTPLYLKGYGQAHQKSEMAHHYPLHHHRSISPVPGLKISNFEKVIFFKEPCLKTVLGTYNF